MITWKTEKRKISELIPAPYNPRELTEQQAKDLSTSLERFNLADPIVINTNNRFNPNRLREVKPQMQDDGNRPYLLSGNHRQVGEVYGEESS